MFDKQWTQKCYSPAEPPLLANKIKFTGLLFFLLLTLRITVSFALLYIPLFKDRVPMSLALIIVILLYTFSVHSGTVFLGNLFDLAILLPGEKSLVFNLFYMGQLPLTVINAITLVIIPVFFTKVFLRLRQDRFFLKTSLLFLVKRHQQVIIDDTWLSGEKKQ